MRKPLLILGLVVGLAAVVFWAAGGLAAMEHAAVASQREVQNALAGALRALRTGQPGAVTGLLALSFGYGFFHAAGPGHGKMLIGAYGLGRRVRFVPLATIAIASSLAQATVAVVLVYSGVLLLGWTRERLVGVGEQVMAPISFAAVAGLGLWLAWRGLRGMSAVRTIAPGRAPSSGPDPDHRPRSEPAMGDAGPLQGRSVAHDCASPPSDTRFAADRSPPARIPADGPGPRHGAHIHERTCGHATTSGGHGHDASCGHVHGPSLDDIARLRSGREALALIAGVAIRPCTGALFVLILTWQMGIGAMGIVAAYAMGLGTASVTLAVAALSVWAREGALASLPGQGLSRLLPMLELVAGSAIALVSTHLLLGAI